MPQENQKDNFYGNTLPYVIETNIALNWYAERIVELLSVHEGQSVLELGIGFGDATIRFAHHCKQHTVVEGDAEVIRMFREKYPHVSSRIIHAMFEDYHPEEQYDLIVVGFILEHVQDPVALLKLYIPFLTPNGRLAIAVPNAESLHRRLGNAMGILPDMTILSDYDFAAGHKRFYTLQRLKDEVTEAGGHIDLIEGIFLKPFTSKQLENIGLQPEVYQALCTVGLNFPELCNSILLVASIGHK